MRGSFPKGLNARQRKGWSCALQQRASWIFAFSRNFIRASLTRSAKQLFPLQRHFIFSVKLKRVINVIFICVFLLFCNNNIITKALLLLQTKITWKYAVIHTCIYRYIVKNNKAVFTWAAHNSLTQMIF